MNMTSNHKDVGLISGLAQELVLGKDLVLLWLWGRLAAAALTGPLALELPYAVGSALKSQKMKQTNKKTPKNQKWRIQKRIYTTESLLLHSRN